MTISIGRYLIFADVCVIILSGAADRFFLHGIIAFFAAYFIPEKLNG